MFQDRDLHLKRYTESVFPLNCKQSTYRRDQISHDQNGLKFFFLLSMRTQKKTLQS